MTWLKALINGFDYLTKFLLADAESKVWRAELNRQVKQYDSPVTKLTNDAFDSIDTKTTALLQHVSIMIAVSGVLLTQASHILSIIFSAEMVIYIFLTLFCLRFLMQHSTIADALNEVTRREMLLELTAQLTFITSLCLMVTVVLELALK